jgi:hypothetical protein
MIAYSSKELPGEMLVIGPDNNSIGIVNPKRFQNSSPQIGNHKITADSGDDGQRQEGTFCIDKLTPPEIDLAALQDTR